MIVYRLSKTKHANDLSGEGARLNGGRWNHKLTACVYTSENRALALLEYTVNVNVADIPRALSLITIEIPEDKIFVHSIADLPGNWRNVPTPASTKDFGTDFLKSISHPIIKLPSTVILEEFNLILNPLHTDSRLFRIINITDFIYDLRIKTV